MSALANGLSGGLSEQYGQMSSSPKDRVRGLTDWTQTDPPRKAPQREGSMNLEISQARALYEQSRDRIKRQIEDLRASYVFASDAVDRFLFDHQAIAAILREAVEPLNASFGPDKVFRLEVHIDEDDSTMLYAVALWRDSVRAAAQALDDFVEAWWLDHMTPSTTDLAFIYKISR